MKTKPKSILILHASVGAGHTRAAKAVASALALEAPDARVVTVDALDLSKALFKRVYGQGYLDLVAKAPKLFGMLFELTDRPARGRAYGDRLRRAVSRWGAKDFVALLEDGQATLKRFFREKDRIRLQPANGSMKPIYVEGNLHIQGVLIGVLRTFGRTALGV
ncbi:MAG: hypothetical protein KGL74_10395 [Elusimicrobia bacterium]|nr:hypothetical protein [Elusimicrobiota bacterium]